MLAADPPGLPEALRKFVTFWTRHRHSWFRRSDAFDREVDAMGRTAHRQLVILGPTGVTRLQRQTDAPSALGTVLLLDQFPRNAFRDTPAMYATDALARTAADVAIGRGLDRVVDPPLQGFFYLPFAHAEDLAAQDRSVALQARLGPRAVAQAQHHRDIIVRFGRFPHRNAILGRATTRAEQSWLESGGFAGARSGSRAPAPRPASDRVPRA